LRVVFDTNILVSAVVFPDGNGARAMHRIIERRDTLVISKAIINELLGVLARKFARDAEELAHLAVFLEDVGEIVEPNRRISVLEDAPDNRILECAIAGNADLIVTGDRAMRKLRRFESVRIVSLRAYLDLD
jgi:putative PIN family toxin of toxin-antitoxin system